MLAHKAIGLLGIIEYRYRHVILHPELSLIRQSIDHIQIGHHPQRRLSISCILGMRCVG
jgi:hypothetical protein